MMSDDDFIYYDDGNRPNLSLGENPNTRNEYLQLEEGDRKKVSSAYHHMVQTDMNVMNKLKIRDKLSPYQFLQKILIQKRNKEEIINIQPNPLYAESFVISSPYTKERVDSGVGVQLYITDRRLLLADTTKNSTSRLDIEYQPNNNKVKDININHRITDSFNFMSFNLIDIYGISMKIENEVKSYNKIIKRPMDWMIGLGIFLIFMALFAMVIGMILINSNAAFGGLMIFGAISLIIIGIALIAIGVYMRAGKPSRMKQRVRQKKILQLITLSPKYRRKCSLEINIDTHAHTLPEIVTWVKNLQTRCPAITDPKPFDTVMEV